MELVINPRFLERSIEPSLMGPDMARFLENVDVTFLDGRIRRGGGYSKTDVNSGAVTKTLISFFVAERWDGAPILLTHNDAKLQSNIIGSTSYVTFINYSDYSYLTSGTLFEESFNEDTTATADPGL
jgi:hypothetical protein